MNLRTPWIKSTHRKSSLAIQDSGDFEVASVSLNKYTENARKHEMADYIVSAVNSHASLTECVKVLREALERTIVHVPNTRSGTAEAARAALSRAKELVP